MLRFFFLTFGLILCTCDILSGQTSMRFTNEPINQSNQVWGVQIDQLNSSIQSVCLQVLIREKNAGVVFGARSSTFSIFPGQQSLYDGIIQVAKTEINNLPINQTLPSGTYWFQAILIDAESNRELVSCIVKGEITGANDKGVLATKSPTNNPGWLNAHGNFQASYFVHTPPPLSSTIPGNYFRASGQGAASIFSLPLLVNGLYSTENGYDLTAPNQVNLSLDKAAIKALGIKRLTQKCSNQQFLDSSEIQTTETYKRLLRDKKYPQYNQWRTKLDSLGIKEADFNVNRQLENVESTLKNRALTSQLEELDALKSKYNVHSMEELDATQDEMLSDSLRFKFSGLFRLEQSYNKLGDKKEVLLEKAKAVRKHERLYQKVKTIENRKTIAELITDADDVKHGLKMLGTLNRLQRILLSMDEFELGSCYPFYSTFTINGARIQGANISFTTLNGWHLGVFGGKKHRESNADTSQVFSKLASLPQRMTGIQLGKGRPEGNHFYMHHIRAYEYGNQPLVGDGLSAKSENYITGFAFGFQDNHKIVAVSGEFNQSIYNPNKLAPSISLTEKVNLSRFLNVYMRAGAAIDIAYSGRVNIRLPNDRTRFVGFVQHVGIGYHTAGLTFLPSDITRFEFRASQDFLSSKLSVESYFKRDFDQNIPELAHFRTNTTMWGGHVRYKFSKVLTFNGDYSPYAQKNNYFNEVRAFNRIGKILFVSLQWNKRINKLQVSTSGGYMFQNLTLVDSIAIFRIHSIQTVTNLTSSRYIVQCSSNYAPKRSANNVPSSLISMDLSFTWLNVFKKGRFTLGCQQLNDTNFSKVKGLYCRSRLPLTEALSIELNYRYAAVEQFVQLVKFSQQSGWVQLQWRW